MKRVFRVLALVLLLALLSSSASAGGWEQFEQPADVGVRNAPYMKYWVYTPDEMKPGLPFVIYLHSSDGISWSAMKDVLPELIGAKPMIAAWRLEADGEILLNGVIGCDPGSEDRGEDPEHADNDADGKKCVGAEKPPYCLTHHWHLTLGSITP